jgi:Sulfotransferase family
MALPNFFIAGAPKAGTDLLYYQLDQHPQILMSALKEPNFFAEEIRLKNFHASLQPQVERGLAEMRAYLNAGASLKRFGGIISDLEDYRLLFASVNEQHAVGEGSVCYLWSRTAALRIADLIPQARVIIMLMDPTERAFHQYLKSLSDRTVAHSFSHHLELAFDDLSEPPSQIRHFNPFLSFGEYAEQVDRYLKIFPQEQLLISLYEDAQEDYDQWFAKVLRFLDVDSSFKPGAVDVPSTPHLPNDIPTPRLLLEDRARLVAYYRTDILRLESLIGRDLSSWLK